MDIVVWIFLKVVRCRQKPNKLLVYVRSNEDSNGTTFIEKPLCNRKLQSDKWSVVQTRKIKIRRKMKSTLFSPNFSVIFSNPFVLSAKRRECFLKPFLVTIKFDNCSAQNVHLLINTPTPLDSFFTKQLRQHVVFQVILCQFMSLLLITPMIYLMQNDYPP